MVGYAGGSLYACQQNEAAQPPYGVEAEQQAVGQEAPDEQAASGQVNAESPPEIGQCADNHA